jgi:hypothetical protein
MCFIKDLHSLIKHRTVVRARFRGLCASVYVLGIASQYHQIELLFDSLVILEVLCYISHGPFHFSYTLTISLAPWFQLLLP